MFKRVLLLMLVLPACVSSLAADEANADSLWTALKTGGYIVLMRHAQTAAGIGDPTGFSIVNCSTQRNLSASGRADARQIGAAFRSRAIPVSAVMSSQWCRCMDTAQLAFGRVESASFLNSIFTDDAQSQAVKKRDFHDFIARFSGKGNLILVTHAANISALTGVSPASGELVVTRTDGAESLQVIGRISVLSL